MSVSNCPVGSCPFCGSTAIIAGVTSGDSPRLMAACGFCYARGPCRDTEAEADAAWNTRTHPIVDPAKVGEVERLVSELEAAAVRSSDIARQMTQAKSLRQEGHNPPRDDLYMWVTPEQTLEGRAAAALTSLRAPELREALEMVRQLEEALSKCRAHVVCHVKPDACCSFEPGGEVFSALDAASLAATALNAARAMLAAAPKAAADVNGSVWQEVGSEFGCPPGIRITEYAKHVRKCMGRYSSLKRIAKAAQDYFSEHQEDGEGVPQLQLKEMLAALDWYEALEENHPSPVSAAAPKAAADGWVERDGTRVRGADDLGNGSPPDDDVRRYEARPDAEKPWLWRVWDISHEAACNHFDFALIDSRGAADDLHEGIARQIADCLNAALRKEG